MTRPAPTPLGAAADDQIARLRLTSRLATAFLLDIIAIARGDGDVLDTLLIGAIIQANVAEINRRADLQLAYAGSGEIPPDEIRRPVSMNALASSLKLPFETVRRRVNTLAGRGLCKFVEGGVIVPSAVLSLPKSYADGLRAYERLRAFYYQLNDLGLIRDLPPPSVVLSASTFPVRAIGRLLGTYVLRVVETLGTMGDLIDGLILLETFRSNVEHLPHDQRGGEGFEPADMVSDRLRTPITVTRLARRIGVPHETARRHITALMARGVCVRARGGLIVPAAALAHPILPTALAGNAGNLHRLFGALAQLGVLKAWDSVHPTPKDAA